MRAYLDTVLASFGGAFLLARVIACTVKASLRCGHSSEARDQTCEQTLGRGIIDIWNKVRKELAWPHEVNCRGNLRRFLMA